MVNLDNIKIGFFAIIIFLCGSCNVNRSFDEVIKNSQKGITMVPLSIARSTIDAADEIYRLDSLPEGTKATIKEMNFRFESRSDSFILALTDVNFQFKNDTLYFENLIIPHYKGYIMSDTLTNFIKCQFQTPKNASVQCFEGEYLLTDTNVINIKKYKVCVP